MWYFFGLVTEPENIDLDLENYKIHRFISLISLSSIIEWINLLIVYVLTFLSLILPINTWKVSALTCQSYVLNRVHMLNLTALIYSRLPVTLMLRGQFI